MEEKRKAERPDGAYVIGVLAAAAIAGGIGETPEDARQPHGRDFPAWRLGAVVLWVESAWFGHPDDQPVWVAEHKQDGCAVPSRFTYKTLREAAADAVALIVRDRVLAALKI